jgi:putative transposase
MLQWLDLPRSTFQDWRRRYRTPNQHNGRIPRNFWLLPWERKAILEYQLGFPDIGYARMAYQMIDDKIVAVSPSTVYRVLRDAGVVRPRNKKTTSKGRGFTQPVRPHQHWHIDFAHLNICGTFYYFCAVVDGFSRLIVAWDIRESMTERDIEIVLQRAREAFPGATPRVISDNGPQFVAGDFREFIRMVGLRHTRISPGYPQSNGKAERFFQTARVPIRRGTPLSLGDALRLMAAFIEYYNRVRLHSAIGYVTPMDKLHGRAEAVIAAREAKLRQARVHRITVWQSAA